MCTHAQEVHDGMTIQGQMGAVGNSAPFMQWNKKVLGNIQYGCWKSPMQRGGSWESLGLIEATSSIDEDEQGVGVVAYMGGNKDDIFKREHFHIHMWPFYSYSYGPSTTPFVNLWQPLCSLLV